MRTFIIGAGFSLATAGGPLMSELWCFIKKAYEKEKELGNSQYRIELYKELNKFINEIEDKTKTLLQEEDRKCIDGGIRENLEYLLTVLDLHDGHSARFSFKMPGKDVEPFPIFLIDDMSPYTIIRLKDAILLYLYIALEGLEGNKELGKFTELIEVNDSFINFNYDLVLEKGLWKKGLWSPLKGYVGVDRFLHETDLQDLLKAGRVSKTFIYKMHGSLIFDKVGEIFQERNLGIVLDNKEREEFFFEGLNNLLSRKPNEVSVKEARNTGRRHSIRYQQPWILPSFVKAIEFEDYYNIWRAAFKQLRQTKELHIIGYSFRPEDFSGQLLLLNLPENCKIILVDPSKCVKKKIENIIGRPINNHFESLNDYIESQKKI